MKETTRYALVMFAAAMIIFAINLAVVSDGVLYVVIDNANVIFLTAAVWVYSLGRFKDTNLRIAVAFLLLGFAWNSIATDQWFTHTSRASAHCSAFL